MDFDDFMKELQSIYFEHETTRIRDAWCLATPEECALRLRAVMALSVELDRIRKVSIFSTALGEGVIANIIQGDWKAAEAIGALFTFEDEAPDLREQYSPLWEGFRVCIRTICAERRRLQEGVRPARN